MRFLVTVLLTALTCFAQATRIEGRVVTPGGTPARRATVRLQRGGQTAQPVVYVETTSAEGRFAVEGIDPGSYVISVETSGYERASKVVNAISGQTVDSGDTVLRPLLAISGVVVGEGGTPVVSATVELMRPPQAPFLQAMRLGHATTDDRGYFRFPNLRGDRYYILASPARNTINSNEKEIRGASTRENYWPTFYPSAIGMAAATPVDIGSGPVENLELKMRWGPVYSIRGRIESDAGPVSGTVILTPTNGNSQIMPMISLNRPVGEFEIRDVAPGEYYANVSVGPPAIDGAYPSAVAAVNVVDADIVNMRIHPAAPFELSVSVTWVQEGQPPNLTSPLYLNLRSMANLSYGNRVESGRVSVKRVVAGDHVLSISNLPASSRVQSVLLNGKDVTGQTLTLDAASRIEVVLTSKTVPVRFVVPDRFENARVMLWPVIADSYTVTGGAQTFFLSSAPTPVPFQPRVPPGEYYAAILDGFPADYRSYSRQDMAIYDPVAARVSITDGESITIMPAIVTPQSVSPARRPPSRPE